MRNFDVGLYQFKKLEQYFYHQVRKQKEKKTGLSLLTRHKSIDENKFCVDRLIRKYEQENSHVSLL